MPDQNKAWQNTPGLLAAVEALAKDKNICFILNTGNTDFHQYWNECPIKPWQGRSTCRRLVVLWAGTPLSPISILSWRCGLIEEGDIAYRFLFLPKKKIKQWDKWLIQKLADWAKPSPEKEKTGLRAGDLVSCSRNDDLHEFAEYDPSFLTISPYGRMATVLERLDTCKRMYRDVTQNRVDAMKAKFHEALENALSLSVQQDDATRRSEFKQSTADLQNTIRNPEFLVDRNLLPKVLLLGPSGAGKTLVARYLAWRTSPSAEMDYSWPFKRIPVPEYLHRESDFEYDVFGYCAGAFTGAHPDGRKGFLLERVGGVVFFDEIGDASPSIQAKLLAYLDDYMVTPRGWSGDPIPCPMMVIAATNRPIDEWAQDAAKDDHEKLFRNDLMRRFNVIIQVPSLEERKKEFDYILDVLIQLDAFNPGKKIKEIGTEALAAFKNFDYSKGNFRDLEVLLRAACRHAGQDGRHYIVKTDVTP